MTRRSLIGLDIGSGRIHAVQLSYAGASPSVCAAMSIPRATQGQAFSLREAELLAGVLARHGFRGQRVAVNAPTDGLKYTLLELPPRDSGAPIEQIATTEAGRIFNMAPGTFELGLWEVPPPQRGGKGLYMMAEVCAHESCDDLITTLEAASFDVCGVYSGQSALAQAAMRSKTEHDAQLIVDCGYSATRIVLSLHGRIIYQRVLGKLGLAELVEDVAGSLSIERSFATKLLLGEIDSGQVARSSNVLRSTYESFSDQLAEETEAALRYAGHRFGDTFGDEVLMTGGGADLQALVNAATGSIRRSIKVLRPVHLVACDNSLMQVCNQSAMTAAFGLTEGGHV